jgi:mannose-6-phosphate isomerase-like protein (cupin superfamily)
MSLREPEPPDPSSSAVLRLNEALSALSNAHGKKFLEMLRHGTLMVEIFKPAPADTQQPHPQDELYFVVCGGADFVHGTEHRRVKFGDVLFVAAGRSHYFENISIDFAVWGVFYGPAGGEMA